MRARHVERRRRGARRSRQVRCVGGERRLHRRRPARRLAAAGAGCFAQDEPAAVEYLVVDGRGVPARRHGRARRHRAPRDQSRARQRRGQRVSHGVHRRMARGRLLRGPLDGGAARRARSRRPRPAATGSRRAIRGHRRPARTRAFSTPGWPARVNSFGATATTTRSRSFPSKRNTTIGDTARYLLKNPYPGARALVTIERYGTLKQWVQTLDGSTPIDRVRGREGLHAGLLSLRARDVAARRDAAAGARRARPGQTGVQARLRRGAGGGPLQANRRRGEDSSRPSTSPARRSARASTRSRASARRASRSRSRSPCSTKPCSISIQGGTTLFRSVRRASTRSTASTCATTACSRGSSAGRRSS